MTDDQQHSIESQLQLLRVVHAAMLLSILLYAWIAEYLVTPNPALVPLLRIVLLTVAAANGVATVLIRRKMILPLHESAFTRGPDVLARWRMANILVFALSEAIALYGFILRILGGGRLESGLFYIAAVILLFVHIPRRPQ
jgi:hypothetical protein